MFGSKVQHSCRTIRKKWNHFLYQEWNREFSSSSASNHNNVILHPIAEVDAVGPSFSHENNATALADAIRPYFEQQTPVILRGAGSQAPALHRWQDLTTALQDRLPSDLLGSVEIGGSYASATTHHAEIPIHDFLHYLQLFEERHGKEGSKDDPWQVPTEISNEELVYMAQNDLPEPLYQDIQIPGFCCQEEERGEENNNNKNPGVGLGRLYGVMMWLGPRGCVSSLHFDPLDNILMQFVGRKAVWLYDPKENEKMWHYAGNKNTKNNSVGQQQVALPQSNTSPVNPEMVVDPSQYPLFVQHSPAPLRGVLYPGDFLYIPSRWWHFIRSVDTSASVNVWWR